MTCMLLLLVCTRFQSLFHSPNRGSFHLSLTVLVHYRSVKSIQPWRMVPPYSVKISRVPTYSSLPTNTPFRIRDYYPLWSVFPYYFAIMYWLDATGLLRFRSPLLTESRLISFPLVTQMFQFSRFALLTYVFSQQYPRKDGFPHSEISGSKLIYQLPEAYRKLLRPSSPFTAQASTMCT